MQQGEGLDNCLDERERILKEWEKRLEERERRSAEWERDYFERNRSDTPTPNTSKTYTNINPNNTYNTESHGSSSSSTNNTNNSYYSYGTTGPLRGSNSTNYYNPYPPATPTRPTPRPLPPPPSPPRPHFNLTEWGSIGAFSTYHPAPSMASPAEVPRVINSRTKKVNIQTEEGNLTDQWKTMFFSLVNYQWRWLALLFFTVYLFSFFFFAIWYFLVDWMNNSECLSFGEGHEFLESFFFSMQTQMTIGYGRISPEAECPSLVLLVTVQSLCGLLLDCIVFGIFFARFSRPQQRAKMVLFGKRAVINSRLGSKYLMIRVANVQWSHLIEAKVTLLLHHSYTTHAAEHALHYQRMTLDHPSELFLGLPTIILHKIDEDSPLFGITKEQLQEQDFEIIAMIEGAEPTTSAIMQVLASYKPRDIFYDHYFEPVVQITDELLHISDEPSYVINLEHFHDVTEE